MYICLLVKTLPVILSPCVTHPLFAKYQFSSTALLTLSPLMLIALPNNPTSSCVSCTQTHRKSVDQFVQMYMQQSISDYWVSEHTHTHIMAFSNIELVELGIKVYWSVATLPSDYLRIVQIYLHKVLLLSMVAIERPGRQCKRVCSVYPVYAYKPCSFIIGIPHTVI